MELRDEGDSFRVYCKGGLNLKLLLVSLPSCGVEEPTVFRAEQGWTVQTLKEAIARVCGCVMCGVGARRPLLGCVGVWCGVGARRLLLGCVVWCGCKEAIARVCGVWCGVGARRPLLGCVVCGVVWVQGGHC